VSETQIVEWMDRRGGSARLGTLATELCGVDFTNRADTAAFRVAIDDLERRGVLRMHLVLGDGVMAELCRPQVAAAR
jgi:hypothetical protein